VWFPTIEYGTGARVGRVVGELWWSPETLERVVAETCIAIKGMGFHRVVAVAPHPDPTVREAVMRAGRTYDEATGEGLVVPDLSTVMTPAEFADHTRAVMMATQPERLRQEPVAGAIEIGVDLLDRAADLVAGSVDGTIRNTFIE